MLAIADFNAAASASTRRAFVVIAAAVLTMLARFAVALPFRDAIHALQARPFGEAAAETLMGLAPVPAMIVLIGGLGANERWAKRDARLNRPCCGKPLMALRHLVVATGNCGYCGKRVPAEPEGIAQPRAVAGPGHGPTSFVITPSPAAA